MLSMTRPSRRRVKTMIQQQQQKRQRQHCSASVMTRMAPKRASITMTGAVAVASAAAATLLVLVFEEPQEQEQQQQQQQRQHPTTTYHPQHQPHLLATAASSGTFRSFFSGLNTNCNNDNAAASTTQQQQIQHKTTNITRRSNSTIEYLHDTANLNPIDVKYKVHWEEPIGKGTFGNVYYAMNRKTGEAVAIKKISKHFTTHESFQREMDNLLFLEHIPGSAGHSSICFMREHFDPAGDEHYYLVLDLVQGGELFDHLVQDGTYNEKDAARVIRQIASALAFLHGIGMVHSDLKPENLMLSSKNRKEATVKIVDFGCAHLINQEEQHERHRGTGLTPGYCPPEVLARKKKDPRSHCKIAPSFDMWSLGVILYVMLTGTHPFDLDGTGVNYEMENRIISYDEKLPIRNCKQTQHLSEDALSVLERLMDRDPERRITAEELLQHPWVNGETATSTVIKDSDKRLKTYLRHQTKVATSLFKGLLSNSDKHGGSQRSRRISVLEMAFRDLDPKHRGYISTKELNGITSFLAADARLSLTELQHLLRDKMIPLHFSKGKVIYDEGGKGDSMYFVQSGSVEVTSKSDGFRTIRKSGEFFGEEALMAGEDGQYSHTACCVTPVHLLKISRECFEKYLQADEEVEITMAETDRKRQRERVKVIFGLQKSLTSLECDPGQMIFREGSEGDLLYILERGKVDVSVDGRKVRSLRIGEMTGEHAAFYAHKAYNVTAQCISPEGCTMQILDGKEIRKMCQKNKDLEESFRDIILRRDFKKALVKATKRDFPETEEELRIAFDTIDTNTSGKIEFETLKEAVLQWDKTYTDDDIRAMLKSLDVKNKGHLTWVEFKRILSMFNDM